jgi:hypothetical protein
MSQETVNLIVGWLPIAVFVCVWIYFVRSQQGNSRRTNREILDLNYEIIAVNKTMSETLIRIEKLLEDTNA